MEEPSFTEVALGADQEYGALLVSRILILML